jgi:hypothetical protein
MKKLVFFLFAALFFACNEKKPVPPTAKLFGEGIISSESPEFATTVNAQQDLVFFNRTTDDRSSMRILYSKLVEGQWSEVDTLAFSTGLYRDVDPFLTANGKRLYFSSTRPVDSLSVAGTYNTWYVEQTGSGWSEPINPGYPLNSDSTEIFVSMTKRGNAYFVSERDGKRNIWVCKFENGQYQEGEKVELKLRDTPIYASNPCIASDESFLIVAARDPEGPGAPDLFISWNEDGNWSDLINLGEEVNSPYAEFAPGLSKDDQILFFSSERPGIVPAQEEGVRPPGDIYSIRLSSLMEKLK